MNMRSFRITALCGCLLLGLSALSAAEPESEKPRPRPAPPPLTVPSKAVQVDANTYTYTDEKGKKWIYRQTPFGLTRFEPRETTAADLEHVKREAALMHAFDDGEYVRFERPGPFGVYRWKQKKTELSTVEQMAWDRARAPKSRESEKE